MPLACGAYNAAPWREPKVQGRNKSKDAAGRRFSQAMSDARTGRFGNAGARIKAQRAEPRAIEHPAWDSTNRDLTCHRLSAEEVMRRKLARVSRFSDVVGDELRDKWERLRDVGVVDPDEQDACPVARPRVGFGSAVPVGRLPVETGPTGEAAPLAAARTSAGPSVLGRSRSVRGYAHAVAARVAARMASSEHVDEEQEAHGPLQNESPMRTEIAAPKAGAVAPAFAAEHDDEASSLASSLLEQFCEEGRAAKEHAPGSGRGAMEQQSVGSPAATTFARVAAVATPSTAAPPTQSPATKPNGRSAAMSARAAFDGASPSPKNTASPSSPATCRLWMTAGRSSPLDGRLAALDGVPAAEGLLEVVERDAVALGAELSALLESAQLDDGVEVGRSVVEEARDAGKMGGELGNDAPCGAGDDEHLFSPRRAQRALSFSHRTAEAVEEDGRGDSAAALFTSDEEEDGAAGAAQDLLLLDSAPVAHSDSILLTPGASAGGLDVVGAAEEAQSSLSSSHPHSFFAPEDEEAPRGGAPEPSASPSISSSVGAGTPAGSALQRLLDFNANKQKSLSELVDAQAERFLNLLKD